MPRVFDSLLQKAGVGLLASLETRDKKGCDSMGFFDYLKKKKLPNAKIEMHGYENDIEVPLKVSKSSKPLEKELADLDATLKLQDMQIKLVHSAEEKYKQDKDINALISFWEKIWEDGGLSFKGSKWTFRLPDLYIKQKRYEDALRILRKINDSDYQEKKLSYIERIKKAQESKK